MKRRLIKFLVFTLMLGVYFGFNSIQSYADYVDELNLIPKVINVDGIEVDRTGTSFIYNISSDTTYVDMTISPENDTNDIYSISVDTDNPLIWYEQAFLQRFDLMTRKGFTINVRSITVPSEQGGTVEKEVHYWLQFIIPSNNDNSGGSGGGGGSSEEPAPVDTTIDPTTNTVVVSVSETQLASLFAMLTDTSDEVKLAIIKIPKVAGLDKYGIQLPYSAFTASNNSGVRLETDIGTLTLMDTMLQNLVATTDLQNVKFNMGYVNKTTLSQEVQDTIGNHPIISLNMELDGTVSEWNNPNSPVIVSVPYTPTAEELTNPELITVYYIDGQGNLNAIPNATYDSTTGCMVFTTTHFSDYAIGYGNKTFTDITDNIVKHGVEVLAAKGIVNGKVGSNFMPKDVVTRAEFITMLSRAFEFNKSFVNTFTDVSSDKYYYKSIGMAKELGIVNGVRNNMFDPNGTLNKEQIEIIVNNLVKAGELKIDDATLMALLSGVDKADRGECAVLIYNLM